MNFVEMEQTIFYQQLEIEDLRGTIQAQVAVIEKLREALSVVMWFVPNHPTVPENKRRFDILKKALALSTDSTTSPLEIEL